MTTYTKNKLSGSTNGLMIKVAQTATLGTTIHTAVAGTTSWDEIHLWAVNADTNAIKLTLEWGGATSPDCLLEITIPPESGLIPIVPGWPLNNAKVVTAFAGSANLIMIGGFVNNIV